MPLLFKYIFTSDRLSIQVHPDDAQAVAKGLLRGKLLWFTPLTGTGTVNAWLGKRAIACCWRAIAP